MQGPARPTWSKLEFSALPKDTSAVRAFAQWTTRSPDWTTADLLGDEMLMSRAITLWNIFLCGFFQTALAWLLHECSAGPVVFYLVNVWLIAGCQLIKTCAVFMNISSCHSLLFFSVINLCFHAVFQYLSPYIQWVCFEMKRFLAECHFNILICPINSVPLISVLFYDQPVWQQRYKCERAVNTS